MSSKYSNSENDQIGILKDKLIFLKNAYASRVPSSEKFELKKDIESTEKELEDALKERDAHGKKRKNHFPIAILFLVIMCVFVGVFSFITKGKGNKQNLDSPKVQNKINNKPPALNFSFDKIGLFIDNFSDQLFGFDLPNFILMY